MNLQWIKCQDDQWCSLLRVNLGHSHFSGLGGVYIIWHGGQNARTVYVGQGEIAERLAAHRKESPILQYSSLGLFVTWARVEAYYRDGIEQFLSQRLGPLVGHRYPEAQPISVNLPW